MNSPEINLPSSIAYTNEQLAKIEECAAVFLNVKDIAAIIDTDYEMLVQDIHNQYTHVSKLYNKSRAMAKLKLQQAEMLTADKSSPVAIQNMKEAYITSEDELI